MDRFPARPRVSLKTVDSPKGNGLRQKKDQEQAWTKVKPTRQREREGLGNSDWEDRDSRTAGLLVMGQFFEVPVRNCVSFIGFATDMRGSLTVTTKGVPCLSSCCGFACSSCPCEINPCCTFIQLFGQLFQTICLSFSSNELLQSEPCLKINGQPEEKKLIQ